MFVGYVLIKETINNAQTIFKIQAPLKFILKLTCAQFLIYWN